MADHTVIGRRVVVAVDESPASHAAFALALTRVKEDDLLVILTVGRRFISSSYSSAIATGQTSEDNRCKKLLRHYAAIAKKKGVNYKLVFTHAEQGLDTGEALTNYLTAHHSEEIYLGRRHLRYIFLKILLFCLFYQKKKKKKKMILY